MSRFNTDTQSNRTVNLAGGEAFVETPKLEFISILLTSFVKDQYYRDAQGGMDQVVNLMANIPDKKFLAKAAIYARTKFGMRSISHVVAAELASMISGQTWAKSFYNNIIYRPDDMTEILAYYESKKGKKQPRSMIKGFASAFSRFDGYQLAKYKGNGKDVSLVDVVNLVHPRAVENNSEALKQLMAGTLKSKDTWESELTKAGQKAETEEEKDTLKTEVWKKLILEKKIGYFALLRNLRNIIEQAPEILPQALELLKDREAIKRSLVLPFRYITAITEIEKLNGNGVREVLQALNGALDIAVDNVPQFDGRTLVVLDASGSMSGQPQEIGSLFASILYKATPSDFIHFGSGAYYQAFNPSDSTLTIANQMKKFDDGGTDFKAIFQEANQAYERIIILSDMQGWEGYDAPTGALAEYRARTGANPRIYSFDLQGYGQLQFPQENVYCIAGFSEKIFDVMKLLEQDKNALISEIEKIEL